MAEAPLVAARIDEGGVIEMGHAELLWWGSASSAQAGQRAEIGHQSGNDNGPYRDRSTEFIRSWLIRYHSDGSPQVSGP